MALRSKSSLVSRLLAILMVTGLVGGMTYILQHQPSANAAGASFSFAAVGDNGSDNGVDDRTNASSKTLQAVGGKNISFMQTLGDLAYDPSPSVTTANGWCQWATNHMKSTNSNVDIPLLLSAGNHEAQDAVSGFAIEDYVAGAACANPFAASTTYYGSSSNNYAKDYYYDYPSVSPSLRVININPGLTYQSGGVHNYTKNGTLYNWVSDAIDAAKANNQWIVVTYHVPYVNAGSAHGSDMTGAIYSPYAQQFHDLFNMFAAKNVDLILNGHEHDYQRSKQFNINGSCTVITHDSYNSNCVLSHTGAGGDPYVKGSGPVELVIGTGGHKPSNVNTGDGDYNFMAKTASGSGDCGFVKFDVTDTTLVGTFVNACGGSLTDSFTIAAPADTTLPVVSFTAPTNAQTVSGSSVNLAATASDNSGTVTKVEFYQGTTLLGEDTTSPYSYTWNTTSLTNGSYTLNAKAYDAAGNIGTASVTVTVDNSVADTTLPTVSLTAPANNATISGSSMLTATASDNVGVTKVEFYQGTTLLGEDTTSPYSYTWNLGAVADGSYTLSAKAYDAAGNIGISGNVTVTVNAAAPADTTLPVVSFTAPTNAQTVSGSSVNLAATASDNSGTVTKVEFYQGTTLLGEDTTSPYSYTWNTTSLTNGSYTLNAKAYDAAGNIGTASVTVTVDNSSTPPPAPTTSFDVTSKDGVTTTVSLTGSCNSISTSGATTSTPSTIDSTKLLTSFTFTSSCPTAGGSATVRIDLGKQYSSSALQIMKTQSDGSLKDITSAVTFDEQTVSGAIHTIISFSVADGTANDADGTSNSTIVDPVFVLGASTAPTTTSGNLANTGSSFIAAISGAIGTLVAAGILVRNRLFARS